MARGSAVLASAAAMVCMLFSTAHAGYEHAESATNATSATKLAYKLRVPALVADANNNTMFQCWEMDMPFQQVTEYPGTAIAELASFGNGTYTVVPGNSYMHLHTAPFYQLVIFTAGEVHVTLPYYDDSLTIHGGLNGLLVANDLEASGHITAFPSSGPTVAVQIAWEDQSPGGTGAPSHTVLHDGPCKKEANIIYGS